VRERRPEHRHHRVADELLNRSTVPLELGTDPRVVGAEQRLDVLGVELLRTGREADEVTEQTRDHLALRACLIRRGGNGRTAERTERELPGQLPSAARADCHATSLGRRESARDPPDTAVANEPTHRFEILRRGLAFRGR